MKAHLLLTLLFLSLQYCAGRIVFGILDGSNTLIRFDSATPQRIISRVAITGLDAGEVVQGGDIRPANGRLYIVTSASNIYTLNTLTGVAYGKGTLLNGCTTPNGASYGIDFNPQGDRLRIINNAGVSYRINVDDFTCITDSLNTNGATIFQVAYTNNVRGATSTSLYAITATALGQIATPNTGVYSQTGLLGFTTSNQTGLDYFGTELWASLTVDGVSGFYSINPSTGAATLQGQIGNGVAVRSIIISFSDISQSFIGLNDEGNLFRFEGEDPTSLSISAISGLNNDFLLGVDFRPANGLLYAVSNSSLVYTINPLTYAATVVGTTLNCTFEGRFTGVDWNPVANALRVISDSGANYRINVETSACFTDGRVPTTSQISSVAYSENFNTATTTSLYAIDYTNDELGIINPPNDGVYNDQGSLTVDTEPAIGFDIFGSGGSNTAVAFLQLAGVPVFVSINLQTGAATYIASPPGPVVRSLSASFNRLPFSLAAYYPDIVILTSDSPQVVHRISSANTGVPINTLTLTGIPSGVTLFGMDIRPSTGEIVALGSDARLYIVALTGIVYPSFELNCSSNIVSGRTYTVDFNPVADRLRIVSDAGDNLRVNTNDGTCLVDGNMVYTVGASGTPNIAGVAYTNSFAGATSTAEYIVDESNDSFGQVTNPNGGQTTLIGPTSVDIASQSPLDVLSNNGQNYGFLITNGVLYDISLGSGNVRSYGALPVSNIIGLTVIPQGYVPPAPPASVSTTGTSPVATTGATVSPVATTGSVIGSTTNLGVTTDNSSGASAIVVPVLLAVASFFVLF